MEDIIYVPTNVHEIKEFLDFIDTNPIIYCFLEYDCCYRLADKYLLSMVFIYFKRIGLHSTNYTALNFFAALALAHAMEEDDTSTGEIYVWALGIENLHELSNFIELKLHLWQAMGYRAVVSSYCCKQVMKMLPDHKAWTRRRNWTHGGAPRDYARSMSPPATPSVEYDNLTNTCAKCRSLRC